MARLQPHPWVSSKKVPNIKNNDLFISVYVITALSKYSWSWDAKTELRHKYILSVVEKGFMSTEYKSIITWLLDWLNHTVLLISGCDNDGSLAHVVSIYLCESWHVVYRTISIITLHVIHCKCNTERFTIIEQSHY